MEQIGTTRDQKSEPCKFSPDRISRSQSAESGFDTHKIETAPFISEEQDWETSLLEPLNDIIPKALAYLDNT